MNLSLPLYQQPYSVFEKIQRERVPFILQMAELFVKEENLAEQLTKTVFTELFMHPMPLETEDNMQLFIRRKFSERVLQYMRDYPETIKAAYHERNNLQNINWRIR